MVWHTYFVFLVVWHTYFVSVVVWHTYLCCGGLAYLLVFVVVWHTYLCLWWSGILTGGCGGLAYLLVFVVVWHTYWCLWWSHTCLGAGAAWQCGHHGRCGLPIPALSGPVTVETSVVPALPPQVDEHVTMFGPEEQGDFLHACGDGRASSTSPRASP